MSHSRICAACGKPFTCCRYNKHHQKYCKRPGCVRRRKRERQRASHNRRYRDDKVYQEEKRRKSREYMRVRRRQKKEAAEEARNYDPMDILTGVVSQLTSENDPEALRERLRSYSSRGRQLSHVGAFSLAEP